MSPRRHTVLPEVLLGNVNILFWLRKLPDLCRESGEDTRSHHHFDSTDLCHVASSPLHLGTVRKKKLKIASGCIWAAVGHE